MRSKDFSPRNCKQQREVRRRTYAYIYDCNTNPGSDIGIFRADIDFTYRCDKYAAADVIFHDWHHYTELRVSAGALGDGAAGGALGGENPVSWLVLGGFLFFEVYFLLLCPASAQTDVWYADADEYDCVWVCVVK